MVKKTASAVRVVCGWCGKLIRDSAEPDAITSTGMCPECQARFEADALTATNAVRRSDK